MPDVYVNCRGETFLKPLTFFELSVFCIPLNQCIVSYTFLNLIVHFILNYPITSLYISKFQNLTCI
jgi:hypothetical protein